VEVTGDDSIRVRIEPRVGAAIIAYPTRGTVLDVIEQQLGEDGRVWYRVRFVSNSGDGFTGWVRSDTVTQVANDPCPDFP
jgi:hypothetical protein